MDMACYRGWATAGSRRDFSLPKEPLISNAGLGERERTGGVPHSATAPPCLGSPQRRSPSVCSWALRAFAASFTREARTNQEGTNEQVHAARNRWGRAAAAPVGTAVAGGLLLSGSTPTLARSVPAGTVARAAVPSGTGYWLTNSAGDVYHFGGAVDYGSMPVSTSTLR